MVREQTFAAFFIVQALDGIRWYVVSNGTSANHAHKVIADVGRKEDATLIATLLNNQPIGGPTHFHD